MAARRLKADIEADLESKTRELAEFRELVQTRIHRALRDGEICEEGYNALALFGLEQPKRDYEVSLTASIRVPYAQLVPDQYQGVDTSYLQQELEDKLSEFLSNVTVGDGSGVYLDSVEEYEAIAHE